jgi:hypothetical protein
MMLVDPPQGYLYGFPKAVPEGWFSTMEWEERKAWFIENGYPEKIIDEYGEYFYCTHTHRD